MSAGAVAGAVRQAIADAQIVAAISDLDQSTARTSVPLLNAAGILHVSPSVTYPGFTTPGFAAGEPDRFYPAGTRSFFSVAPDDAVQARALAGALRGRVLVEQEESPSGRAFGAALRSALGPGRLARDARRASAAVYAGTDAGNARGVVESLLRENQTMRVYLPVALAGSSLLENGRVSAVTPWPAPDRAFRRAFSDAFGREPGSDALAGHTAMRAVLAALGRAGARADSRQAVIDAFARAARAPRGLFSLSRRAGSLRSEPL
jgi:branched-chain amino acid transport system substrate-binding protein